MRGEQQKVQTNSSLCWQPLVIDRFIGRVFQPTAQRPKENVDGAHNYCILAPGLKAELEHLFEPKLLDTQAKKRSTKLNTEGSINQRAQIPKLVNIWQDCSKSWSQPQEILYNKGGLCGLWYLPTLRYYVQ